MLKLSRLVTWKLAILLVMVISSTRQTISVEYLKTINMRRPCMKLSTRGPVQVHRSRRLSPVLVSTNTRKVVIWRFLSTIYYEEPTQSYIAHLQFCYLLNMYRIKINLCKSIDYNYSLIAKSKILLSLHKCVNVGTSYYFIL